MTDAFSDLVMPIFQKVIELKDKLTWGESPSLDDVKKKTRSWIDNAELRARGDDGLAQEFGLAKFGLVAWIDEVLTDSSWGKSVGWGSEDHVLEWNLYKTNLRAGRFYEMAEDAYEAVSQSRSSTDPLEVYLLCVALGFRGDLRHREDRAQDWVDRIYAKISETSPMASKPFPDDPSGGKPPGLAPRQGPELLLKVSILSAITALATLIGYLVAVHVDYYSQV